MQNASKIAKKNSPRISFVLISCQTVFGVDLRRKSDRHFPNFLVVPPSFLSICGFSSDILACSVAWPQLGCWVDLHRVWRTV